MDKQEIIIIYVIGYADQNGNNKPVPLFKSDEWSGTLYPYHFLSNISILVYIFVPLYVYSGIYPFTDDVEFVDMLYNVALFGSIYLPFPFMFKFEG